MDEHPRGNSRAIKSVCCATDSVREDGASSSAASPASRGGWCTRRGLPCSGRNCERDGEPVAIPASRGPRLASLFLFVQVGWNSGASATARGVRAGRRGQAENANRPNVQFSTGREREFCAHYSWLRNRSSSGGNARFRGTRVHAHPAIPLSGRSRWRRVRHGEAGRRTRCDGTRCRG